ncbi:MAG: C25 family cysteine peptidase [Candidatus Fermentibacteraceae bacterium]
MKSITPLILVLFLGLARGEWHDFGTDGATSSRVTLLEATPGGMLLDVTVPGVDISPVMMNGTIFHHIEVPGGTPAALETGAPMMPSLGFLAAIPASGQVQIVVEDAHWVDLGVVNPYPMQPIPADNTYEPIPFTHNAGYYGSGTHPSHEAAVVVDGILRGVTIGRFNIAPFQWDASTGVLSAAARMRVRVTFDGTVTVDQRLYSRFWEPTFRMCLLNSEVLGEPVRTISADPAPIIATNARDAMEIDAADLLIIAGDDFADTMMSEFITKKTAQGYLTAVVAAGSWTTTQIKDYIQNAYDTWSIPPSFILFVGDAPELPPYYANGMYGDNRYCCVDGTDYLADIYNSRFVTPTSHYPIVEAKVLKWQFDPLMDESFWGNVLTAGMIQTNGGTVATRWFCFTLETVRDTYMNIYGKTVQREYVKDTSQPPPYYYRSDLPSAGQMVPADIVWDGNAAGITEAINNGVFLVQHRDHGSVSGWADPSFTTSNLSSLTNGNKTPLVMSTNCQTGQFVDNCFAENLFRMQGGAVGVIAAVQVSYSYFNDYITYGLYKAFNDEYTSPPFTYTEPGGNYLAGQALMCSKLEMQAAAPFNPYGSWAGYAEDEWDLFHWFGDPTMDLRTQVPGENTVSAPFTLPAGSAQAAFTVGGTEGPVEGALVCLMHEDGLWASGVTDASGNVTLSFDPIGTLNDITWMVTSHNTLPVQGVVNGVGIEGSAAGVMRFSITQPRPNPASGMVWFPVSTPDGGVLEITVFDTAGRVVAVVHNGELAAGSHTLSWNTESVPQGVYLVRISTPSGSPATTRLVVAR